MNFNDDESEKRGGAVEQSDDKQDAASAGSTEPGMQPPEVASKRAVEEAERKADGARNRAEEVHARLAERIDEIEEQVAQLDRLLNAVYRMGATREDEPPLNDEMPHVVPSNRDDDTGPDPFKGGNDA